MKKILLTMAAIVLCAVCFSQGVQWKEFENFHQLVGKVLHPVMLGKVQQVRDSSATLLESAKQWQASAIPATVNAAVFKARMGDLVNTCAALNGAVQQKQPDGALKTLAVKVHDTFHALLWACKIKD